MDDVSSLFSSGDDDDDDAKRLSELRLQDGKLLKPRPRCRKAHDISIIPSLSRVDDGIMALLHLSSFRQWRPSSQITAARRHHGQLQHLVTHDPASVVCGRTAVSSHQRHQEKQKNTEETARRRRIASLATNHAYQFLVSVVGD